MDSKVTTSQWFPQLSGREAWKSTSKRWVGGNNKSCGGGGGIGRSEGSLKQMEGLNMYGSDNNNGGLAMRKRLMVVVDDSSHSKHAMMWALTHVANKGDLLTLLHIIPASHDSSSVSPYLANSLGSLCKACKPEVEVEALVIQGPRLGTVISQVKKLEVSVLVLGQKKSSSLISWWVQFHKIPILHLKLIIHPQSELLILFGSSSTEDFVEHCINNAECLTIGVRKQSKGVGGYLINTRWQKDFWLLA
ncbi:Adenine nucleotide alpha hydrolases-like superfamily protein [Prunus dulcis]|uniref:Adenine nucleotide alpha hydrolases-like superfamily protein n=1 Tax=Prunus dulcis TaxID=3755 RepID=A0A4Y1QUU2_PRUDU|nr:Adenine nucleotide alpha hydrolases-like superfamily protein [Prunus dulcis]